MSDNSSMSETKMINWGMFAVALAQFIVAWLEFKKNKKIDELKKDLNKQSKLIKKLEEKQQNYKNEERLELKNLAKKFEEMHTSIFKVAALPNFLYNKIGYKGWQELDHEKLKGKEEDDYDESFLEKMRKIINELKINEEEDSFIAIVKTTQKPFLELSSSKEEDEPIEFIKWKKYKEIFSKSTNFYNYFDNLNNLVSGDSTKKLLFSLDMIITLYFKILSS
jgi:hypothetical protein